MTLLLQSMYFGRFKRNSFDKNIITLLQLFLMYTQQLLFLSCRKHRGFGKNTIILSLLEENMQNLVFDSPGGLMTSSPRSSSPFALSLAHLEDEMSRDSGFGSPDCAFQKDGSDQPPPCVSSSGGSREKKTSRRCLFSDFKSAFASKRSRGDDEDLGSAFKRIRVQDTLDYQLCLSPPLSRLRQSEGSTHEQVKSAVDRLQRTENLIGDGSQNHVLPTTCGRHQDLKSISPQTVYDLLRGKYSDVIKQHDIIDCRYPYEFDGGHIQGAINIFTEEGISELVENHQSDGRRHVLIFHCEYSSQRAPKMMRLLRSQDRKSNSDQYPFLYYPEIYLLDGGYKEFFSYHKDFCVPQSYLSMHHEDHAADLRHFRVKSKSWTAGESRGRSRRSLICQSPLFS
ncbi:M-phase inducer phosphatase 1-like [Gigantopelta aegis]|uniref:M-phase inducer phosphatase 1-like n=1 Tax=Gigantopelta aegis TaxID=1735272 RepID=UPI001B88880D|nr:M-phase inducer phosphatase 1-like [Gigantopelta aegis]